MKAVVNATLLIALSVIGHLDLLERLFESVYVPHSVYEEVVVRGRDRPGSLVVQQADWLDTQKPSQTSPIPVALMGLDIGEQDVILLGQELNADWLIIDERLGRNIAQAMNFRVKGTLGILLVARQQRLISVAEAKQAVQPLHQSSVRISPRLLSWFQSQIESA